MNRDEGPRVAAPASFLFSQAIQLWPQTCITYPESKRSALSWLLLLRRHFGDPLLLRSMPLFEYSFPPLGPY